MFNMFTLTIGAISVEVKLGYDLRVDAIHFKQLETSKLVLLKLGGLHYSVPLLVNGGVQPENPSQKIFEDLRNQTPPMRIWQLYDTYSGYDQSTRLKVTNF